MSETDGDQTASALDAEEKSSSASKPSTHRLILPPGASFTRRCIATLVDMCIFVTFSVWLLAQLLPPDASVTSAAHLDRLFATVRDSAWLSHASGSLGIWIAAWWGYFGLGWGLAGATPGKWILGLCVVDHQARYPIGVSRGLLRLVAYMASSMTLGLGHLFVLGRGDHRALHDILAGTRVIRRRDAHRCGILRTSPPNASSECD
ncbi:MAG: RDD family protein [bacterium]|nr:RDD family protein [bacterium]